MHPGSLSRGVFIRKHSTFNFQRLTYLMGLDGSCHAAPMASFLFLLGPCVGKYSNYLPQKQCNTSTWVFVAVVGDGKSFQIWLVYIFGFEETVLVKIRYTWFIMVLFCMFWFIHRNWNIVFYAIQIYILLLQILTWTILLWTVDISYSQAMSQLQWMHTLVTIRKHSDYHGMLQI